MSERWVGGEKRMYLFPSLCFIGAPGNDPLATDLNSALQKAMVRDGGWVTVVRAAAGEPE